MARDVLHGGVQTKMQLGVVSLPDLPDHMRRSFSSTIAQSGKEIPLEKPQFLLVQSLEPNPLALSRARGSIPSLT